MPPFAMQFNFVNGIELVCRAHQLVQEGLKYMFQEKGLVTVSSYSHPHRLTLSILVESY
jgi:serine/threonine-protein phosphatase 6 catalytic subunit